MLCEIGRLTRGGVPTRSGDVCLVCFEQAEGNVLHSTGPYRLCTHHADVVHSVMATASSLASLTVCHY